MDKQVTVSGLLAETMAVLSAARLPMLLYVLVLGGVSAAGVLLGLADTVSTSSGLGTRIPMDQGAGAALFALGSGVLSVIAGFLLAKAVLATRRTVRPGMGGFGGYFALSFLYGLGVIVGLFLLVIPGIVMMVRWSASTGFLLGSHKGSSDALSASWQATKGHAVAIFLAAVILVLAAVGIGAVPVGLLSVADEFLGAAVSGFFEAIAGGLFVAFAAGVYFRVDESASAYVDVFD